ncbi:MAG: hypothetical protein AAGH17_09985, partial [Pseudomonadota bacterium]
MKPASFGKLISLCEQTHRLPSAEHQTEMAWAGFIIAFAAFLISHSVPVRPPIRTWLTHRLGHR